MTLAQTLTQLFPCSTVGYAESTDPDGTFELNGLLAGAEPASGEILARGHQRTFRENERREHFLVRTPSHLLFFRVCTAGEGSGYAEFATGSAYVVDGPDANEYLEKNLERLKYLCK